MSFITTTSAHLDSGTRFPCLCLRQAWTWDLLLQCMRLDTPLLQQQNTKKLYGIKNNWSKFWTKDTRRPIDTYCRFWRVWSKCGLLRKSPAHNITKGGGETPELPFQPDPWTHPYPHSHEEPARPHLREQALCSRDPSNALPEFLVWPLVNFYWLRKAKNSGQYREHN